MRSNEELKKRLVADYERVLDELLAKRKPDDEITLSEIEQWVMEAREEVSEDLLAALTEVREWEQPTCPSCGGKTHYKGQRSKQVVTVSGEVRLTSGYYYCPVCQTGFFPSA
jgi:tRNA(Ile2) C34 agmatinyltransferase TiaS